MRSAHHPLHESNGLYQDWYEKDEEELRDYASDGMGGFSDTTDRINPSPEMFRWEFQELSVSELLRVWPKDRWRRWYENERAARRDEDGDDNYFDGLENEWGTEPSPIGPIVVVRIGKTLDIGDGWHRSAIAVTQGWKTVPAVVGTVRRASFAVREHRVCETEVSRFMPRSRFILAGHRAIDAISNLDDIQPSLLEGDSMSDAAYRALEAGAEPPLEYIGAGATGIVFCDPHLAFKVARHRRGRTLEDEAEWLETAIGIPEVRPHVARVERWDPKHRVIVRECVRGSRGTWGGSRKIHELWDYIAPYMLAEGWTMPELKEDSVIFDDSGRPKIVDAGMASRVSNRLLGYVDAVLDGRIDPDKYEDPSTLAFYVRREFGQKPPMDEERARRILERLYALGARRD
jgi:hypothetical protein